MINLSPGSHDTGRSEHHIPTGTAWSVLKPGLVLLSVLVLLHGCAVPVPPTGGPPDQDPPTLISTTPADGSVNVDAEKISFQFDERLDERSVTRALSVTPEFETPPLVRVRGDRVEIEFPDALRPNTTYIVSLDTGLRDAHSVALLQPLSVAFGTGPTINEGTMDGLILEENRGQPASGVDVYAYAMPDSGSISPSSAAPVYRTQSNDQGRFSFGNVSEQSYYVIALRDGNTNRRLDPTEPFGAPPIQWILADSSRSEIETPWVLASPDTEPPVIRRVRSLSNSQIEIRFSESVILQDTVSTDWSVQDSLSATARRIRSVYAGADPRDVVLLTDSLAAVAHSLTGYGSVTDSTGNGMIPDTLQFTPSSRSYTPAPAFEEFLPTDLVPEEVNLFMLWPGIDPGLRMTEPLGEDWLARISVTDTTGGALPFSLATQDGVRYDVQDVESEIPFDISILEPDTTFTRRFLRADATRLGELSGVVRSNMEGGQIVVELVRDETRTGETRTLSMDGTGSFRFDNLPGGARYRLRYFLDLNGNSSWDAGSAVDYRAAEPIGWTDVEEPIRARWETAVPDTLSLGGH